jgi:hypothetical protein
MSKGACNRSWFVDMELMQALSTTDRFRSVTDWFPVANGGSVGATIRPAITGNGQGYLAVRYATVRPDNPDAPSTIGAVFNSASSEDGRNTTLSAGGKMWAQLGRVFNLSSGTVEAGVTLGMDLWLHQCVEVVGSLAVSVDPSLANSTANNDAVVYPIGPFIPRVGLAKVKAGVVARGLLTTATETMLVYRTATNRAKPGGWVFTLEAGWDVPYNGSDAYDERCTGELSPSFATNDTLVQLGLAVRRNGAGSPRCDLEVSALAIR